MNVLIQLVNLGVFKNLVGCCVNNVLFYLGQIDSKNVKLYT